MVNMAVYTRIFEMAPTDEYVLKRNRAARNIVNWLSEISPSEKAIDVASDISNGVETGILSKQLTQVVGDLIQAESDSFIIEGAEKQILVCTLAAALELIEATPIMNEGGSFADILAACLWSSLSFQHPVENVGLEGLRSDLLKACITRTNQLSIKSRERVEVPDIGKLIIPEGTPEGTRANTVFRNATRPLVTALRNNAELDREEIDFLWWILSDRSDTLNIPFKELDNISRAIISGLDGAVKLRKLPTSGHKHIVLRSINSNGDLSLSEVLPHLDAYRDKLSKIFANSLNKQNEIVFPLLTALANGNTAMKGSDIKRSAFDWGSRALLEGGILQINARKEQ